MTEVAGLYPLDRRCSVLVHGAGIYLHPVDETALVRMFDERGHMTITRQGLVVFVDINREKFSSDETTLLKMWGRGRGFLALLEAVPGTALFNAEAWRRGLRDHPDSNLGNTEDAA